jgi:hypothetical protein
MARPIPPDKASPNRSWRLTFQYEGDAVTLVEQEQVAMLAPPDDPPELVRGQSGYHVELQDRSGKPIYRRVLHAPIRDAYEVFSPEPGAPISHVPMDRPHGFFKVVVPDVEGGHSVVVVGPAAGRGPRRALARTEAAAAEAPATIIRVPLRGKPRGKGDQP